MKDDQAGGDPQALQAALSERDRRYTERFDAQERANKLALDAAKEAVLKAEAASEKRFDGVNEFRAALSDQAAQLMPRGDVEALVAGIRADIGRLESAAAISVGRGIGASNLWGFIIGGAGVLLAGAMLAANLIR